MMHRVDPGRISMPMLGAGAVDDQVTPWNRGATRRTGSRWEAWAECELERSGYERSARDGAWEAVHPPITAAPGSHVLDRDLA